MNRRETVEVEDSLGIKYDFDVYEINEDIYCESGIYILVQEVANGYESLYVGKSIHVKDRVPYHEKLDEMKEDECTHVLVRRFCKNELRDIEQSFIESLSPKYNNQHNS